MYINQFCKNLISDAVYGQNVDSWEKLSKDEQHQLINSCINDPSFDVCDIFCDSIQIQSLTQQLLTNQISRNDYVNTILTGLSDYFSEIFQDYIQEQYLQRYYEFDEYDQYMCAIEVKGYHMQQQLQEMHLVS